MTWGADHLTGHDAATGKLLWECGGFNPDNDVELADDCVGCGQRWDCDRAVWAGRVSGRHSRWAVAGILRRVAGFGRRLVGEERRCSDAGGCGRQGVSCLTDKGRIACVNMKTGDEIWTADLPQNRNKFYGSPVLAGDKLYCVREDGIMFVGRVNDKGFELLADHNDMGGRMIASPVPIRDGLLVRGDEYLYMIGPGAAAGNSYEATDCDAHMNLAAKQMVSEECLIRVRNGERDESFFDLLEAGCDVNPVLIEAFDCELDAALVILLLESLAAPRFIGGSISGTVLHDLRLRCGSRQWMDWRPSRRLKLLVRYAPLAIDNSPRTLSATNFENGLTKQFSRSNIRLDSGFVLWRSASTRVRFSPADSFSYAAGRFSVRFLSCRVCRRTWRAV